MANVGFATLQVIPSLRGLDASINKGFAPAQGIAANQGAVAGKAFGGKFGSTLKGVLPGSLGGLSLAAGGIVAAGAAVGTLVGFGIKAAASFQQTRIAFEGILGSAESADKFLDEMRAFAAKTPFEFPELADSAKNLLAVGFAAQDVIPTMTTLGNVAATLGVGGAEIQGVVRALGQMKGKGKASAEEFQQISEQLPGFSAIKAVAEDMGVSVPEAFKLMEKGAIPADRAITAILNGMKKFPGAAGAMERQSKTLNGVMSTFKDTMRDVLVDAIEPLLPALSNGLLAVTPVLQRGLKVFTDAITDALPVVLDLFSSIAHAASELMPALLPLGAVAAGLFKGALPLLSTFSAGLEFLADVLGNVPGPVLAAAGAIAVLAAAYKSLMAEGLVFKAISAIAGLNPVVLGLVAAITAVGFAVKLFSGSADPAEKAAKELGKAMFDASNDAGIFASGIDDAAEGVAKFLKSQIDAGKDDGLADALTKGGSSVAELVDHLGAGTEAWDKYALSVATAGADLDHKPFTAFQKQLLALNDSAFNANKNTGLLTKTQRKELQVTRDSLGVLDQQFDAFEKSARAQLRLRISSGDLTNAQLHQIKATNKNRDGTINYAGVLDDVSEKLASLAEKTDIAAQAVAESTPLYADMVNKFASGKISADDFATVLKNKFKLSADGAKDAAKQLGDEVKELASRVESSFPAISDAAKGLKNDVVGVAADLASRQSKFARQLAVSEQLGSGASQTLRDNISENLKGIRDDFKLLAANTDPQKFTENLLKQAQSISNFFSNIKILVQQGFPELANTLLDMGVVAGGSLAAGFASDKNLAAAGNAGTHLVANTKGAMSQWVLSHKSELEGIGRSITDGVAWGIAINPSATHAASRMVDGVKSVIRGQFRISSPSKWARDEIGKNVVAGFAEGLDPARVDVPAKKLMDRVKKTLSAPLKLGGIDESALGKRTNALIARIKIAAERLRAAQERLFRFASDPLNDGLAVPKKAVAQAHKELAALQAQLAQQRPPVTNAQLGDALIARTQAAAEKLRAAQEKLFRFASDPGHDPLGVAQKRVALAEKGLNASIAKLSKTPAAFQKYLSTLSVQKQQDFSNLFRIAAEQEVARKKWLVALNGPKPAPVRHAPLQTTLTPAARASAAVGPFLRDIIIHVDGDMIGVPGGLKQLIRREVVPVLRNHHVPTVPGAPR